MMNQAIEKLGENLPQAFFAANDAIALGALRSLNEHKISVPDRVSLISFNDTSLAKYAFPSLSAVKVFTEEMGGRCQDAGRRTERRNQRSADDNAGYLLD